MKRILIIAGPNGAGCPEFVNADLIAAEIVKSLEAALEEFRAVEEALATID